MVLTELLDTGSGLTQVTLCSGLHACPSSGLGNILSQLASSLVFSLATEMVNSAEAPRTAAGVFFTDSKVHGAESEWPSSKGGLSTAYMKPDFILASQSFLVQGLQSLQILQRS